MAVLIFLVILVIVIYVYSFNNRDRNLDYKLTPQYQKSGNNDKLRTDIIKSLEITIKNEIISNYSNRDFRNKAIENFIDAREVSFYKNVNILSQQHKISHNEVYDEVFLGCNYVRVQFNIPTQPIPLNEPQKIGDFSSENSNPSKSDSFGLTKKQKLSCNALLSSIIYSTKAEKPELYKLYTNVERNQLEFLGLKISETSSYLGAIQGNFPLHKEILKSLNNKQKDLLISMALDLLTCNGIPSKDEYVKFEQVFEKVAGIDKNDFSDRILKINAIIDKFSK